MSHGAPAFAHLAPPPRPKHPSSPPHPPARIPPPQFIPARMLALGQADEEATVVYASTAQYGAVFAVVDRGDGGPRTTCLLLEGQDVPNGIAYDPSTGSLYIAAVRLLTGLAALREPKSGASSQPIPPSMSNPNRLPPKTRRSPP